MESKEVDLNELQSYRNIFSIIDVKNKHYIDLEDLSQYFSKIGEDVTKSDFMDMMKEIGKTQKNIITEEEFCKLMSKYSHLSDSEREEHEAFDVYDYDGSDSLNIQDLSSSIGKIPTEQECELLIREAVKFSNSNSFDRTAFHKILNYKFPTSSPNKPV